MIGRSARAFHNAWESRTPTHHEVADLVGVAERLCAEAASVVPSEEYRAGLRTLLMTRVELPRPAGAASARHQPRRALPVVSRLSIACLAAVGALGMVAASAQSLPGDPLYPIKRAIESALVAIQPSDTAKSHIQLDAAGRRLAEAAQLAGEHSPAARGKVADALADFVTAGSAALHELQAGGLDPSTASGVSDFVSRSNVRLTQLKTVLPTGADDEFADATALLGQLAALLPTPPSSPLTSALGAPPASSAPAQSVGSRLSVGLSAPSTASSTPQQLLQPLTSPATDTAGTDGLDGLVPSLLGSLLN